jgi:quinoprotein dehydrogenase-associated probable ABC transporter substrate-binding protein
MCFRSLRAILLTVTIFYAATSTSAQKPTLHVCADPDNLPFSDLHERGFENRLAQMVGNYLHDNIQFVWQRIGRGFVREFMDKGKCDVVIGIPATFRPLLTTQPYYRSSFVFVTRKSHAYKPTSLDDPQLKNYRIGVEALEEEYTPPAEALSRRGLQSELVGIYAVGSHSFDLAKAVSHSEVDFAIMWGPTAGYIAKHSSHTLTVTPIQPESDGPLPFTFAISMGVRKRNHELQSNLDQFIDTNRAEIQKLLNSYGVPQLPLSQTPSQARR